MSNENLLLHYPRDFGDGVFLGNDNAGFFNKNTLEQALEMGWSSGCPVTEEIIEKYGAEWARNRYAECNFWSGYILSRVHSLNPHLFSVMTAPLSRKPDEPMGKHEPSNVPLSHREKIAYMSTIWGYSLGRILIEQIGRGQDKSQKRLAKALIILDKAIPNSDNPFDLIVTLADRVARADAKPAALLPHVLSRSYLEEENTRSWLLLLFTKIQDKSKILWQAYKKMSPKEREDHGIIEVSSLIHPPYS